MEKLSQESIDAKLKEGHTLVFGISCHDEKSYVLGVPQETYFGELKSTNDLELTVDAFVEKYFKADSKDPKFISIKSRYETIKANAEGNPVYYILGFSPDQLPTYSGDTITKVRDALVLKDEMKALVFKVYIKPAM